jgi:hypothetical protein
MYGTSVVAAFLSSDTVFFKEIQARNNSAWRSKPAAELALLISRTR